MEDNKNKRTSGNDILREAAMEAQRVQKDVSPDETIVFRRDTVSRHTSGSLSSGNPRPDLENTAQIRGGAVIRPLKKQGSQARSQSVQNSSPAAPGRKPTANGRSQATTSLYSGTNIKQTAKPAGSDSAARVQTTPRTSSPNKGIQTSRTQATPSGNKRSDYVLPMTRQKPQTAVSQKPVSHGRTENDDYLIDEATYRKPTKQKRSDSTLTDSASSAIMSLVKAVIYIVVIIAVSVVLSVFVINTANDIFKFVVEDKIVTVEIPEYATISDVADALYHSKAIKSKWAFKLWSNIKDPNAEFVAGSYDVSTTLNYDYLRATFKKSTRLVEVRVTIPEGYTVDEIIDLFVEKGIGTREAFEDVINNYEFDYPFLRELEVSPNRIWRLEGYLFPDTYNFYLDSSDEDSKSEITAIAKLLNNFDRKFVSEYYARAEQLGFTVDEAITLASIIEKETRYADELGGVSSVFHNRLKYSAQFPYLNSDATIMYAIAHDTGSRLETMTGKDTAYETPYNTYKYKGLPPGPIANPGLNAIKYALYPSTTNYFYFVTDNSGHTLFATTDSEHQRNIAKVRAGA